MFKSEKGASAVEFAIIAPLLFVLTFGIIEFGILLFDKAVVTNASREGARAAIIFNVVDNGDGTTTYTPPSQTEIDGVVQKYTDQYLINLGSSSVLPSPVITCYDTDHVTVVDPCVSGGDVLVSVTYTYDFLVFPNLASLFGDSFDGTINLVGRTRMRME